MHKIERIFYLIFLYKKMPGSICANVKTCSPMCIQNGHCDSRSLPGINPDAQTTYHFTVFPLREPYKNDKEGWTTVAIRKKKTNTHPSNYK